MQRLMSMSFALLRRDAIAQAIDLQRCSLLSDHLACPQKVSITDSQSVSWRCIVVVQVHGRIPGAVGQEYQGHAIASLCSKMPEWCQRIDGLRGSET